MLVGGAAGLGAEGKLPGRLRGRKIARGQRRRDRHGAVDTHGDRAVGRHVDRHAPEGAAQIHVTRRKGRAVVFDQDPVGAKLGHLHDQAGRGDALIGARGGRGDHPVVKAGAIGATAIRSPVIKLRREGRRARRAQSGQHEGAGPGTRIRGQNEFIIRRIQRGAVAKRVPARGQRGAEGRVDVVRGGAVGDLERIDREIVDRMLAVRCAGAGGKGKLPRALRRRHVVRAEVHGGDRLAIHGEREQAEGRHGHIDRLARGADEGNIHLRENLVIVADFHPVVAEFPKGDHQPRRDHAGLQRRGARERRTGQELTVVEAEAFRAAGIVHDQFEPGRESRGARGADRRQRHDAAGIIRCRCQLEDAARQGCGVRYGPAGWQRSGKIVGEEVRVGLRREACGGDLHRDRRAGHRVEGRTAGEHRGARRGVGCAQISE